MLFEHKEIVIEGSQGLLLPFSQLISYGSLLFVSGMTSRDVKTGERIPGTIEEETERALRNIDFLLRTASSSLDYVLKTSVYLTNVKEDFSKMNNIYEKFFTKIKPARTTIGIQLASTLKIEIDAIAYIPKK